MSSKLNLYALLHSIFTTAEFKQSDGTIVPPKTKLQLIINEKMKNGQTRSKLLDISIPKEKVEKYRSQIGKEVTVEVGIYGKDYGFYGV